MTRAGTLLPDVLASRLPAGFVDRRVNWLAVARKDVADAARSWQLIALCGLFVGLVQLLTTVPLLSGGETTFESGGRLLFFGFGSLAPLVGLLLGYRAVVGEQERGSLRVLLGLPITRRDVLVGKLLARSVLLGAVVVAGLAISGVALWYTAEGFEFSTFLLLVGLTLVFGIVFVAMGVGISAVARSRAGSMAAVMSVYILLLFVWRAIPNALFYLKHGQFVRTHEGSVAAWLVFVGEANPFRIFGRFTNYLITGGRGEPYITFTVTDSMITHADPFYLQPTFLLLVLILWGVVPLVVGAWRFSRADLG